jgi:dTDP-4-dehydrorhamnose reductase
MRVLVTGEEGQVVRSLIERASEHPSIEIVALGRPFLDLVDPESIATSMAAARPDIVVSAAAYTSVDKAEDVPDLAFLINKRGAGQVARAARTAGVPVIRLSTDYLFSGEQEQPYTDTMATGPRSVSGVSKPACEEEAREANPDHLILRTAWVYSPFGTNFAKMMLALARTQDQLNVVDDQHCNPTSALDIADAIFGIVNRKKICSAGIYHFAGAGEATWWGFARRIFRASRELGGPFAEVEAITSEEYPTRATRPKTSRLDNTRFVVDFGYWRRTGARTRTRLGGGNWRCAVEARVKGSLRTIHRPAEFVSVSYSMDEVPDVWLMIQIDVQSIASPLGVQFGLALCKETTRERLSSLLPYSRTRLMLVRWILDRVGGKQLQASLLNDTATSGISIRTRIRTARRIQGPEEIRSAHTASVADKRRVDASKI